MAPVPVPVLWQRARGLYRGNCHFSFFFFFFLAEGRAPTELFSFFSFSFFKSADIQFWALPLNF